MLFHMKRYTCNVSCVFIYYKDTHLKLLPANSKSDICRIVDSQEITSPLNLPSISTVLFTF